MPGWDVSSESRQDSGAHCPWAFLGGPLGKMVLYFVVIECSLTLFPEPQSCVGVIPGQTPEALKNQDILSLIFQHFDLQPGSQTVAQTRKDLFSAARTCKAFVEPALDSLWRVLPSLLPLLLLLPSAEVSNGRYVSSISSCQ